MEPLVVVGLLSGGKDSCYNLCHCAKLGHKVAALATLAPPEGKDELDSYMYQTVGHDAIHLIAEAMELPLYRTTITGQALNQSSSYGQRLASTSSHTLDAADETEDLYTLLKMVKSAQPEVNAVSVGAILSNYQRVRVEHVALRVGIQLLPLSFLWQRDQAELLDDMCRAGMDSILIKVAGAGLEELDLNKSLTKMRSKLHKLHNIYGAHICGEGGEYETFTLDCPLFKKKIVLDKTTTVVHSDSSFASVFYMQIDAAHLEDKERDATTIEHVTVPPLLDVLSEKTLTYCTETASHTPPSTKDYSPPPTPPLPPHRSHTTRRGHWCAIGSIIGRKSKSIQEEFRSAFDHLMDELAQQSLSSAHLIHLNVYLSSQTHFAALNEVYKSYFGVDPPSRACVAINIDEQSCHIVMDAVAFDDGVRYDYNQTSLPIASRPRKVLHVQGRSYWAAANIGPYSQSVNANGRITIAGQIGLLPTTLQLATPESLQIILALQHARRIFKATLEARVEKQRGWIEGCICWVDDRKWLPFAQRAWRFQQDDDEDEEVEGWESQWIGAGLELDCVPIAFILCAKGALPRSAVVEWQLLAHDGRAVKNSSGDGGDGDDDDDDNDEAPLPLSSHGESIAVANLFGSSSIITSKKGASSLGMAYLNKQKGRGETSPSASATFQSALNAKVIYSQEEDIEILRADKDVLPAATTFVPVFACYNAQLQPVDVTLIWQGV